MQGKIAVEEHFALAETAAKSVRHPDDSYWAAIHGKLIDLSAFHTIFGGSITG